MRITKIEHKSGTRYTLYVDEQYFYIFDIEILETFGIHEGMEVDISLLRKMKTKAEIRKARERAFYLLSYRDYSSQELYQKLCKSVHPKVAAYTIEKMISLSLINDEAYAQKLALFYLKQKGWSARKALYEIRRKGIEPELAKQAIENCHIAPHQQILSLLQTKYASVLRKPNGENKVLQALARLGFSYADSKTALAEYYESQS